MATLKEQADRGIDRAIKLLIDEGYVKGFYTLPAARERVPKTACGTRRCLVGALDAGFNQQRVFATDWARGRESRRRESAKPALRRAYAALNYAAIKHTRRRQSQSAEGFESPAESYSEHDATKRGDVIALLCRAKDYTDLTTPELEAAVDAAA
jgi:hypothetical protein